MPDTRVAVAAAQDANVARMTRQREYIERLAPELRRVMGTQKQTDRLVRIAISAARSSEMMQRATPLSLAGALMTAAVLGLEVNTPTQEAYLVPYQNRRAPKVDGEFQVEAQLIVGYQGFVKLHRQHPSAGDIYAEAVYPEDDFHYAKGTNPYIHHVPKPEARAEGSEPTHYYAVAQLANGATPFVVLTAAEVRKLRKGKVGPSGDIEDPQRWMERKVPLKQLTKLLPKSTEMSLAVAADEEGGTELYRQRVQAERADQPPALDTAITPDGRTDVVDTSTGAIVEDPPPGGEGL
jgi:recombination protein RecT